MDNICDNVSLFNYRLAALEKYVHESPSVTVSVRQQLEPSMSKFPKVYPQAGICHTVTFHG